MSRKLFLIQRIVLITFFFTASLFAQNEPITVESKIDKSKITIGDVVNYSVIIKRDADVQVEMPGLAANLGAFEIRDYEVLEPQKEDGKIVEKFEYKISTFDTGEFEIPPLTIYYTLPGDSVKHSLKTETLKIEVLSLNPSKKGDIRDIKQPLNLPRDLRQYILWGGLGLILVLAALTAFYVWKRKKAGKSIIPRKVEPPKPAHEIALEALENLRESSLIQEGKIKEFFVQISEIIRNYIEGRYFVPALEMTTFELLENLRQNQIEDGIIQTIAEFLEICDLVKFAKYQPSSEEIDSTLNKAFEIVDKTKLVFEPESEEYPEKEGQQKTGEKTVESKEVTEITNTETSK